MGARREVHGCRMRWQFNISLPVMSGSARVWSAGPAFNTGLGWGLKKCKASRSWRRSLCQLKEDYSPIAHKSRKHRSSSSSVFGLGKHCGTGDEMQNRSCSVQVLPIQLNFWNCSGLHWRTHTDGTCFTVHFPPSRMPFSQESYHAQREITTQDRWWWRTPPRYTMISLPFNILLHARQLLEHLLA